jgi:hypothetical protein
MPYWRVIKLYPRTLEITGLFTYFHQHVRWIMSHQMAANLLIYNRVFCAQNPSGHWNHRKDPYINLCSPILNVQRRWCLLYHNQVRERDQRVRCWNISCLVQWGISWKEIQLIDVSDVEVALCKFWSIRTLYKALILNSCLCIIRICLCSGSGGAATRTGIDVRFLENYYRFATNWLNYKMNNWQPD